VFAADELVTLFYAVVSSDGTVTYANAGTSHRSSSVATAWSSRCRRQAHHPSASSR
jgi:hypothetical protein